jgi:hypothetical protein
MSAVTPETCRVTLQWINVCVLLHQVGNPYWQWIMMHGTMNIKFTEFTFLFKTILILSFPYRVSSISYNKCVQQMRLVLYLYFIYLLSPYMFRAFLGPSSGVSQAVVMLPFGSCNVGWPSVCPADGQPTLHEPNGSITTAWDTPDDGPKKARNM